MNALQEQVERKALPIRNDEFAIEYKIPLGQAECLRNNFGKITAKVLTGFRSHLNDTAVTNEEASKAVPLRLILPQLPDRQTIDGAGFHHALFPGTIDRRGTAA